jgi:hypothetical protein
LVLREKWIKDLQKTVVQTRKSKLLEALYRNQSIKRQIPVGEASQTLPGHTERPDSFTHQHIYKPLQATSLFLLQMQE